MFAGDLQIFGKDTQRKVSIRYSTTFEYGNGHKIEVGFMSVIE